MAELDNRIRKLDKEALVNIDETIKKINIALHLNAQKLKNKPLPPKLKKLVEWRDALQYWKERYGEPTDDVEFMAERLGSFYEICATLK